MSAWDEVAPGVFAHDDRSGVWSLRTHAVVLRDGSLAVISPTSKLPESVHAALAEIGRPSLLVPPNHFHHLGLGEWMRRYAGARVVCTDGARPRLARQHRAIAFGGIASLAELLPAHVTVLEPPGLRTGELWLRIETPRGNAWLVGDAFFDHPEVPRGVVGAFFRLTDTAPGLKLGRTFTTLAVGDRRAYAAWLIDRIERDRPTVLIPSHGDVLFDRALPERLREIVRDRLGA